MNAKKQKDNQERTRTESFILSHLQSPKRIHLEGEKDVFFRVFRELNAKGFEEHTCTKGRNENKITYYNIPAAFDIETSSFYKGEEKQGCMYIWQLGVCGYNFTGRTWEAFLEALRGIKEALEINPLKRLVIYVHNLSYEFQWVRKHLKWRQVFAIDSRKVAYGVTEDGFEFRCSYILTGKSLEMVGNDLTVLPCDKLHSLDYSLTRLPSSEISPEEMDYCINDIRVVQHLILEKIMQDGNIAKIPLTKTGYCRRFLRSKCLYGDRSSHKGETGNHYKKYRRLMNVLHLDGYREYRLCKDAFMGGFTHSNPKRTRKIIKDGQAGSIDYTSDYPFHMVAYPRYPMSAGEFVRPRNWDEVNHNLKYYACIFEIELVDLKATFFNDFYIPRSKCRCVKGEVVSNGRIVSAERLTMTMTELDFEIICRTYEFDRDKSRIGYFVRYRRGYLPTPIVEGVLELYKDKTELKGVEDQQEYYQLRKELLNSCYLWVHSYRHPPARASLCG